MTTGQDDDAHRAAITARVQARLQASREAKAAREKAASEELVVSATEVEAAIEVAQAKTEQAWLDLEANERSRWLSVVSALFLIGSMLGVISGALILQGNPSDLLTSPLFKASDAVNLTGTAIEAEEGIGIEGVVVELLDYESKTVLLETTSDENGFFRIDNVQQKLQIMRLSKDGYVTIERTVVPDNAGVGPITMRNGEGVANEIGHTDIDGWTLENAVGLSTTIGILTVITGLVGIQAAIETKRAKKYRRTQYLAGISLFSRGLIIFGPALILAGMAILVVLKEEFADVEED